VWWPARLRVGRARAGGAEGGSSLVPTRHRGIAATSPNAVFTWAFQSRPSTSRTMRLFIALNLSKRERDRVHKAVRRLREEDMPVRWVPPEQYHVTLKFLGELRAERVPAVTEAMGKVASSTKTFATALRGFGAFPTIRRPRVIWLGVDANPELRCLKQDLEWAMGDVGFDVETRSFHPHVTLGRADDRGGAGAFRGLDDLVADLDLRAEVKVQALDLMRSQLSREGTRYSLVASTRLAT